MSTITFGWNDPKSNISDGVHKWKIAKVAPFKAGGGVTFILNALDVAQEDQSIDIPVFVKYSNFDDDNIHSTKFLETVGAKIVSLGGKVTVSLDPDTVIGLIVYAEYKSGLTAKGVAEYKVLGSTSSLNPPVGYKEPEFTATYANEASITAAPATIKPLVDPFADE